MKKLITAFATIISFAGLVFGVSIVLQPGESLLGIFVILGAAFVGAAAIISGVNDAYDLVGKITGKTEKRLLEKQRKREILRDFLADDLQRMGGLVVGGASIGIRIASQPKLAKLLDGLIRKTSAMEVEFMTDEELRNTFSELSKLGRLAWDHQITEKEIEFFLDCRQRLENALVSLEKELDGY